MNEIQKQARLAGLLYVLACATAPFCLIYVPRALIVPGDATATADHVRALGSLLHLGMTSELIVTAAFLFVTLALYRLFRPVQETLALAMVVLFAVSAPISLLNVLNESAALILASGAPFLSVFGTRQLDAVVLLLLKLHGQGLYLAEIFWGLWLFPFAMLVMRSGFIPRALGVPMIFGGVGYLLGSFTSLLLPQYARVVYPLSTALEFGELPIVFWLLIWGAKGPRNKASRA